MADNIKQKVFHAMLSKSMEKTEKASLLVRGYFTSDNKDEYGDIITRAATEAALPKYRQWMNIRLMHQPIPVGKVTRIGEADGLEWNELEIEVIDPHAVFLVENGLLPALSVGIFVDYKDVDMLQDGGYVINAYTLAEISLVDHPANYDAFLSDLAVEQSMALMVRTFGLENVSSAISALTEKSMPKNKDITAGEVDSPVEEPIVEDAAVTEPVAAEIEADADAPAEVEEEVEAVADEVEAEEEAEPVPAEADVDPVEVDAPVETEPVVQEAAVPDIAALANALSTMTAEFSQLMAELKAARGQVEVPQITGQTVDGAVDDAQTEDQAEIDLSLEPEVDGTAVNRSGAVQPTELPSEIEEVVQPDAGRSLSLRDALTRHFQINSTK